MPIKQQPFSGEADMRAMTTLCQAFPAENMHVVDLPYHLSSWAFDDADNVALWVDETGRLLAWAVMQTPFWTIDYVYHPRIAKPKLPVRSSR